MFQLIYTSAASNSLDDFALRELAQTSAYNNQACGITGMLLFHNGSILQVLEGDEDTVKALYEKIENDLRHTGSMVLLSRHCKNREFSEWFMGYKNISGQSRGENLFKLTQQSLKAIMPSAPSEELRTLTNTYARVSGV